MAWQPYLFVLPNPWTGIDTDGRTYAFPAGFVPHDPKDFPDHSLVGSAIHSVEVLVAAQARTLGGRTITTSPAIQRTRFWYTTEPVRVPNKGYYINEIRQGHLIAATVETYVACGFRAEEFVEPDVLLAQLREVAITEKLAECPDMPEVSDPLTENPFATPEPLPVATPGSPLTASATLTDASGKVTELVGTVEHMDNEPGPGISLGGFEPASADSVALPEPAEAPAPELDSSASRNSRKR